jgi:hypothetical protein
MENDRKLVLLRIVDAPPRLDRIAVRFSGRAADQANHSHLHYLEALLQCFWSENPAPEKVIWRPAWQSTAVYIGLTT